MILYKYKISLITVILSIILFFADSLPALQSDVTGDGVVNFEDLAVLCDEWLQTETNSLPALQSDVTGDGVVNFEDLAVLCDEWLQTDMQTEGKVLDVDFSKAENSLNHRRLIFERNSVAYERDGKLKDPNARRTENVTVSTPVEYTNVYGYRVMAADSNYVYACSGQGSQILSRTNSSGVSFSKIHSFSDGIYSIFITSQGTLLASVGDNSNVYRCNSNGIWSIVLTLLAPTSHVAPFQWGELGGRVFVGEYRSSKNDNNARRIYMSEDDGVSFKVIHEPNNIFLSDNNGRHLHKIVPCYVNGQLRVYAAYGDGLCKTFCYITQSDSDGNDWVETEIKVPYPFQPTSGIWLPEQNCIVWGTDGGSHIGIWKHDLSTNTFQSVLETMWNDPSNSSIYTYNYLSDCIAGDIYMMTGSQASDKGEQSGIWVSKDGVNWTRAVRYTTSPEIGTLNFIGLGPEGKVWCSKTKGGSFYFDCPNVYTLEGTLVERASNNLYKSCTGEGDNCYTVDHNVNVEVEDELFVKWAGIWNGLSKYFREDPVGVPINNDRFAVLTKKAGSIDYLEFPENETFSSGEQLFFGFRIKGLIGDGYGHNMGFNKWARSYLVTQLFDDKSNFNSLTRSVYINESNWQWVMLNVPCTHNHNFAKSRSRSYLYIDADPVNEPAVFDIYMDGITCEKAICPAEYSNPDDQRKAEVLSYESPMALSSFTDIFMFAFRFGDFDCGAPFSGDKSSYIYLRSYASDDKRKFMAIVYDVYDFKFKLISESNDVQTLLAESSTVNFISYEPVTVGVVKDSDISAKLLVWEGGKFEAVDAPFGANYSISKCFWGGHPEGEQGGSTIFIKDVMWNTPKDTSEVKLLMKTIMSE